MNDFSHQRHAPPTSLKHPRELMVAVPPMRSNVNLSRIMRTAGCCGVTRLIACGQPRIDVKIARDSVDHVQLETHRTLAPVLKAYQAKGYHLVGLEQTTNSQTIYSFPFPRRSLLVLGHERLGLTEDILQLLDAVVEIPVYGRPFSHNVATALAMALYEYCRQYPEG